MIQFETETGKYVAFIPAGNYISLCNDTGKPKEGFPDDFPDGNYEIIGLVGELTWEQKCGIYPYSQESINEFRKCLHIHEGVNLTDHHLILKLIN